MFADARTGRLGASVVDQHVIQEFSEMDVASNVQSRSSTRGLFKQRIDGQNRSMANGWQPI